jgi:hypothetical protein
MPIKSKSSTTTELLHNPHPGEILMEEFLAPMRLSQTALARAIGVPPRRINEITAALLTPPVPRESAPSCACPCGSS